MNWYRVDDLTYAVTGLRHGTEVGLVTAKEDGIYHYVKDINFFCNSINGGFSSQAREHIEQKYGTFANFLRIYPSRKIHNLAIMKDFMLDKGCGTCFDSYSRGLSDKAKELYLLGYLKEHDYGFRGKEHTPLWDVLAG